MDRDNLNTQTSGKAADAELAVVRRLIALGQKQDAEIRLRRAAEAGNAEAMMALGELLLSSPPPVAPSVIEEAKRSLVNAAHAGHGPAAHLTSLLLAFDHSLQDNWIYALSYLGRGAKAGHGISQAELAFLAGDQEVVAAVERGELHSAETWYRLHDSIDIASWTDVPAIQIISMDPFVATVESFLATSVCDWIVRRARPKLARAKTYNPLTGGGSAEVNRTNSEMRFAFADLDLAIVFAIYRMAKLCGRSMTGMEPVSVLRYAVGEEYRPHHDFLDPRIPSFRAEIAKVGQRDITFLIYLNDDFEGGETDFPRLRYRFKGRKGDAILFRNVDEAGTPDFKTLHAGLAPRRGEKWLLSQWMRTKKDQRVQGGS